MSRSKTLVLLGIVLVASLWFYQTHRPWPIANKPPRPGIVLLGDSLTTGLGIGRENAYHSHLSGLLGIPAEAVIPRGVNGRTLEEGLSALAREVISTNAGTVVILLGGNDMLRMRESEDALADAEQIVKTLIENGRMVVLCDFSPLLIHRGWAKGFRRIARENGAILVPGVVDGLYDLGGGEHQSSDNIHLTTSGHRVMAERIAEAMRPHLGATQ